MMMLMLLKLWQVLLPLQLKATADSAAVKAVGDAASIAAGKREMMLLVMLVGLAVASVVAAKTTANSAAGKSTSDAETLLLKLLQMLTLPLLLLLKLLQMLLLRLLPFLYFVCCHCNGAMQHILCFDMTVFTRPKSAHASS